MSGYLISSFEHKGSPWRFINNLPLKVQLYAYISPILIPASKYRPSSTEYIAELEPKSSFFALKTQKGTDLSPGDIIHVLWTDIETKNTYEIARSVALLNDSRQMMIGDVVYDDKGSLSPFIDIHHDIAAIRFHNHLSFPIDITVIRSGQTRGLTIGRMSGDDGTDFMSGSPNSVLLSNERFGYNIGDRIQFHILTKRYKIFYTEVIIKDNYMSDIFVGDSTQHYVQTFQDEFSYRIDTPNITGIKYYDTPKYAYGEKEVLGTLIKSTKQKEYIPVIAVTQGVKL